MTKLDLITGFLGSGKTTFIKEYAKYLVDRGENVAIIVNDYGAINVDRLLLDDALGECCHLEMVIGGDADCTRRRMKTKLISMAMYGYTYVIVEPSGVFDIDDFLDMLYEEPLERWYDMNSIISIVEADIDRNMSDASRYILTSEVARAGTVVLSKSDGSDKCQMLDYLNEGLEHFGCDRRLEDIYVWRRGETSVEDFKHISASRYTSGDMVRLPLTKDMYNALFYFHVRTDISDLQSTIRDIFEDEAAGNIIRLKGFIRDDNGGWLEVNATKWKVDISPISTGQELFIVIGEGLDFEAIGKHWISYKNGL